MELTVKNVSDKLFAGINQIFVDKGFKLNRKNKEFVRTYNDCKQIFDLFFSKERNHLIIEPRIRIKVKVIDEIYEAVSEVKGRPYCCLGNHLFKILSYIDIGEEIDKGSSNDWLVEGEGHISKLVEVIPEYLEETIIPYFDENSSLPRVDRLLNKHPRELSIHNNIYPLRANVAIIAAKLNNNPHYGELVEIYEEELSEAEETYKEEFYRLKEYLNTIVK